MVKMSWKAEVRIFEKLLMCLEVKLSFCHYVL